MAKVWLIDSYLLLAVVFLFVSTTRGFDRPCYPEELPFLNAEVC